MGNGLASSWEAYYPQIYFLYGLAFFAMGLALWLESRRASQLPLGHAVRWLALFGLLHSAHEFWEMFGLVEGHPLALWEHTAQTALLGISFILLIAFGADLLAGKHDKEGLAAQVIILAVAAYIIQIMLIHLIYHCSWEELILAAHGLARYTLGIPGAVLAALGLLRQRRVLLEQNMQPFARDLSVAAGALMWYGVVGQTFTHKSILIPSTYINSALFEQWFGLPIQVIRATTGVVIAVAMIRALRAFEEEHRRTLSEAQAKERELKTAAREVLLLHETSHLLTQTHDLDALLQSAVDRIVQVIEPLKRGAIVVAGHAGVESRYIACCGYTDPAHLTLDDAIPVQWLNQAGVDVTAQIPQTPALTPFPILSVRRIVLPLESNQRTLGKIVLETDPDGPYLTSLQVPTIFALIRQLTIAIENAELMLVLRQREARRSELLQRVTSAQEGERKRIARELHDETGQALTALALGLKGVSKLMKRDPQRAAQHIDQLVDISTQALEELRHLVTDLRPSHLDLLGLVATLRWYIEQIALRHPVRIELHTSGDAYPLGPELETMLFRIAQEGLTNVIKHADAEHVSVTLCFMTDRIEMEIRDDGRGFEVGHVLEPGAERAWGLVGIRERVALAGGHLDVQSEIGKGTLIRVTAPPLEANTEMWVEQEGIDAPH